MVPLQTPSSHRPRLPRGFRHLDGTSEPALQSQWLQLTESKAGSALTYLSSSSCCKTALGFPLVPAALTEGSRKCLLGIEESMSPSWVEGGLFWDAPSTARSSRAPCTLAGAVPVPRPVFQPCSWVGATQATLERSGSGTGQGRASPSLAADMTTVVLSLGRRRIFPWLKATLTNSLGWMDQEKTGEEV